MQITASTQQYGIAVFLLASIQFNFIIKYHTVQIPTFCSLLILSLELSILCCAYHLELTAEESTTSRETCGDTVYESFSYQDCWIFLPHLKHPRDATELHCHFFSELLSNVIMKLHRQGHRHNITCPYSYINRVYFVY